MLDVDLPKDVLAKGAHGLSPTLIAMLDAELKQAQEQQLAVYAAEKQAKESAAAAHAGVAPDWKPPETPDEPGGYRTDGDLSMYSEEMLHRRKRLQEHPGVVQAIQAWWAWLPKDRVEVPVEEEEEEQEEEEGEGGGKGGGGDQQGATRGRSGRFGTLPRHSRGTSLDRASVRSPSPVSTPTKSVAATSLAGDFESTVGTRTRVVEGIVKPVYCATVVVLQLVLLPRYGLEPDPHYDPSEDWAEDSKENPNGPLTYDQFFQAMFQLADQWVDGVVGWDYAKLLADLLQDVQMHERDNLLLSRVMQRYGYEPYYPEWMAQGPQFVPPRALPEQKDEAAEAAWERTLDEEEQRRYEDTMYAEDEDDEDGSEEEDEDQLMPKRKRKVRTARAKAPAAPAPDAKPRRSPAPTAAVHPPKPAAVARVVAFGASRSPSPASEPASGRGSPSMWTAARKAKIMVAAGFSHAFDLISKLLSTEHKPTPVSATHLAAVLGALGKPEDAAQARRLTGLRSLRIRFGHADAPAAPKPSSSHSPSRPSRESLYRAPPAPQVRYRSPPGTRRQRPVPMLPLVPADMYYILPRYWTYSDQLPDKVPRPRPATAPDPFNDAPGGADAAAAKRSEPETAQASGRGQVQGHAWTASLQQPHPAAAGLFTHVSPPWHHQPPSLATTQLELVIPPRRRGAGAGPGPVSSSLSPKAYRRERSTGCTQSLRRSLPDDDPAFSNAGGVMRASSQSLLSISHTTRLGSSAVSTGTRRSGDGASERVSPDGPLAVGAETSLAMGATAPGADRCPSILSSSLQLPPGLTAPPSTASAEDGQLLGLCQADAAARRLMWLKVGRSGDRPATTTLPSMTAPRPDVTRQKIRSTTSSPQRAMPPVRAAQGQPTPDSARSRDVLAGLPFSAQTDRFTPWSPPARSTATTPGSPGATSRPRHGSTSEGWRVWNDSAAACQFVQRVSPGLPRFYHLRTVPTTGPMPQQGGTQGTVR